MLKFLLNLRLQSFPKNSREVEEETNLVFILIDEVESLAAATKSALSGSEPSDSIQVTPASFLKWHLQINMPDGECATNSAGEVKISTKCDNFDNIQNNCCYCGGPSHLRTNELLTNTAVNSR
ncbi:uncharacterized protein LOC133706850 isoform X1 [Rosa rugosa]|uniref:uncharacterized protein LOC133706850 isoform X1 n=1 Tax=Rosa rugosa TaxID=74645 RepID=UPI002B401919|nr:uncharacterized protein LOC133706850 isoform X1 [Rosa rugosa]XP_061988388.1 uncharacterized protein LOC133706850 isoform X1 [Rosa rugosa]